MADSVIQIYEALLRQHEINDNRLRIRYNLISALRLAVVMAFLACLYFYLKTAYFPLLPAMVAAVVVFIGLMVIHQKIAWQKKLTTSLVHVNTAELSYLRQEGIPFKAGTEYIDPAHPYANDLDIFGPHSLFQHLNRTATHIGQYRFAQLLLTLLAPEAIKAHQEAVRELVQQLSWRQEMQAIGTITADNKDIYEKLIHWTKTPVASLHWLLRGLSFVLPGIMLVLLAGYLFTQDSFYSNLVMKLFPINLMVAFSQAKKMRAENIAADTIHDILKKYGILLEKIEQAPFESSKLKELRHKLYADNHHATASREIKRLSVLFSNLDNLHNVFGAVLLNGFLLYHLHIYEALLRWKQTYSAQIEGWLEVLGSMEALSSLANLAHNNPDFTYPVLNDRYEVSLTALGHPLLHRSKRICNDISFEEHRLVILTGSNMSGKSTFLRTLGVNMVLAGTGSPVCATAAAVHPLPILVSMRQSDSLSDSESYFFAEVKRLHYIIQQAGLQKSWVLLDEILRGTNSDDKRSGTIGVIEKIIDLQAIGAIATHDLEVCETTKRYPDVLVNRCFEVEIVQDELVFDYQLRPGICKNKSATFLMKKMGIICL